MAWKVFYSFHYEQDSSRAEKVRQIRFVEGNQPATDNDWETITKGGAATIQKWLDSQLQGKDATIVLIGEYTAERKLINYEIRRAWQARKGVLGIYVHNLEDRWGEQSPKGRNPFDDITFRSGTFSRIVIAYDPPFSRSKDVYNHIADNISAWISDAVKIRGQYA
ncbi:MAG TPA: TIR domain-containing protein [Candidatus Hydrogenedentes bacterium]|nr:TIR domain-containing protein [Candidatus Hydrogenedentota bacterium]HQH52086.1 TIR domain-containing protein [Candidatus Hydrogenedentota bacterium]